MEFNFQNKKDELNKSNELKTQQQVDAQADVSNKSADVSETAETNKKTNKESKQQKNAGNVVVSYVGRGVWVDSDHKCWSRNVNEGANILSSRTYSKEEYELRDDIKFMVNYGEMSIVEV